MVKLLDNYPFSDEWKVMELGEDLSNRDKYHVVYKKMMMVIGIYMICIVKTIHMKVSILWCQWGQFTVD